VFSRREVLTVTCNLRIEGLWGDDGFGTDQGGAEMTALLT